MIHGRFVQLLRFAFATISASLAFAAPVEFSFRIDHDPAENPFSRDIWVELKSPNGQQLQLPPFYHGDGTWSVRARAAEKGNYEFVGAEELIDRTSALLSVSLRSKDRFRVKDSDPLGPAISIDPRTNRTFLDGLGQLYVPFGGNLP